MAAILPRRYPARKHRGRSPWRRPFRPRIELLEGRTLLSGDLNQVFIAQVYRDLLAPRQPSRPGKPSGATCSSEGVSRAEVAEGIVDSPESRSQMVQDAYHQFLDRLPDPPGLDFWVAFRAEGGSTGQLQAGILGSPEYFDRYGGNNGAFVTALFHDILSRGAEASALAAFTAALDGGVSRDDVALRVLSSPEAQRDEVQKLYQHYLRRPADTDGIAFHLDQLQHGQSVKQILAQFIGSPEYLRRLPEFSEPGGHDRPGRAADAVDRRRPARPEPPGDRLHGLSRW